MFNVNIWGNLVSREDQYDSNIARFDRFFCAQQCSLIYFGLIQTYFSVFGAAAAIIGNLCKCAFIKKTPQKPS